MPYVEIFALWSHKPLEYDSNLSGIPDYLISKRSGLGKIIFEVPYVAVVEAKKDDLVGVQMNRISGSVDAFLAIADQNLQELVSDDDGGGGQNAKIDSFRIPEDGKYYIIATRADRATGTTTGKYKLAFQSLGNAFDGVPEGTHPPNRSYGSSVH